MQAAGFDPLGLTAEASLNKVVIGDFGCPEVAGMRAWKACSREAMLSLATERGLTGLRPGKLSDGIAAAAASASTRAAQAATAVLETYGRRLGALIATLRDPRTPGEQGRTPARHAYLSSWLAVDSVWLAGGLLEGRCGPVILAGAQAGAAAARYPCRVALTPYPAIAPLLGAALRTPATAAGDMIAVADLGHTSIKTALAQRQAAVLTKFRLLAACPAPSVRSADEIEDTVAGALARAARHVAAHPDTRQVRVIASVASYISAGAPADDGRGIYGCLANRVPSLRSRLSAGVGTDVTLEFVHDGTAAAATAGSINSATITAGTALGSGFRPAQAPPSLDLAPDLWAGRDDRSCRERLRSFAQVEAGGDASQGLS
jgi:hypothetical protein